MNTSDHTSDHTDDHTLGTTDNGADPYEEGYLAHDAGSPATANPYPDEDDNNVRWAEGWADAELDDVEVARIMDPELDEAHNKLEGDAPKNVGDLDTLAI